MTTVTVDNAGRMVLPEDVREAMGLDEGGQLDIEVSKDPTGTTVVLRAHIPDEDAWAYTEEHRAAVREARADIAAGRVQKLTVDEFRRMAEANENGRE